MALILFSLLSYSYFVSLLFRFPNMSYKKKRWNLANYHYLFRYIYIYACQKGKKTKNDMQRQSWYSCIFSYIDALYALLWQEKHINWCLTGIIFITTASNIYIEKPFSREKPPRYSKLKQKQNYPRSSFSCRVQFPYSFFSPTHANNKSRCR
jgi:hypothetical protein